MENIMVRDRCEQFVAKESPTERVSGFEAENPNRKLHMFAAHLFRKWMLYDPEHRERYFHHILSNIKEETEVHDLSLLLTKTARHGKMFP